MSLSAAPNGFTPPLHGIPPQQLNYAPPPQYLRPTRAALKRTRLGDKYFMILCLVLLGYALGGRGFAYWGVNPLFIGEIMLLTGVAVMLRLQMIGKLLSQRFFIPLMIFMVWGLCRTVPFLDEYQKDAIRDAVFWGYGTFAFIVAGLIMQNPLRVQKIVLYGRKFVILFLCFAPISAVAVSFFESSIPTIPGSDSVPMIQVKGGDLCVHLAGCYSYIVALGKGIHPVIYLLMLPLNLGLNIQGRAGMVAFALSVAVAAVLRPFQARAMRIWFVIALGLFAMWASDIRVEKGARELSFKQLTKGITSIVVETGDEAVDGSKKWRQDWWGKIIDYTVYGKYFWTGKGFGVNLAHEDGFDTDQEQTLRSPHNGHMTVLARMGVPGAVIWATVQLSWAAMIVRAYFRARKRKHLNWSGLFMFIGTYWVAFMANAAFDVFLEGPMGGIWMWCLYGAGVGCVWVYKRYPDLLTSPEMLAKQQAGRFEMGSVPTVTTVR